MIFASNNQTFIMDNVLIPSPAADLTRENFLKTIPELKDIPAVNSFTHVATAFVNSNGRSGLQAIHTKPGIDQGDAAANLSFTNANLDGDNRHKITVIAYLMNLWYNIGPALKAGEKEVTGSEGPKDFQREYSKMSSGGGGMVNFQEEAFK
jgi:hypothetical protein